MISSQRSPRLDSMRPNAQAQRPRLAAGNVLIPGKMNCGSRGPLERFVRRRPLNIRRRQITKRSEFMALRSFMRFWALTGAKNSSRVKGRCTSNQAQDRRDQMVHIGRKMQEVDRRESRRHQDRDTPPKNQSHEKVQCTQRSATHLCKDLKPIVAERISLVQCFQTLSEWSTCARHYTSSLVASHAESHGPNANMGHHIIYVQRNLQPPNAQSSAGRGCRPLRVDSWQNKLRQPRSAGAPR